MWDEGKICPRRIASAPPSCRLRLGGHPKSAGTPSPSPAAAAPTCLWGRGRRGGPDVTGGLSQSELSFPSPKGIPGPQQGPGARPSSDDPQPGLKRGPAPGRGHRGWDPAERGGPGCRCPGRLQRAQRGAAGAGVTQRAARREHGRGARRLRGRLSFPRWRLAPGPGSASAQLGAFGPLQVSPGPCDPGPQPGRAGHEVSVPRAPAKPALDSSRVGSGPELSAAQPAAQMGKLRPRGAGLRLKSQTRRMLLALVTLGEALPLPGPP